MHVRQADRQEGEARKGHRDYSVEGRRAGVYAKECASIPTEGEDSGETDQDWL